MFSKYIKQNLKIKQTYRLINKKIKKIYGNYSNKMIKEKYSSLQLWFWDDDDGGGGEDSEYPILEYNQTLNMPIAYTMAHFASISYCMDHISIGLWNCTRCQFKPVQNFVLEKTIFNEEWDVFAYAGYSPKIDAKVIVFRGTDPDSFWNWIEDFNVWLIKYRLDIPETESCYVHSGFATLWSEGLMKNVTNTFTHLLEKYGKDGPVYIVGHSLGGAMAYLCSAYMGYRFNLTNLHVFTFGTPRVGNHDFASYLNDMLEESWRFTHMKDPVPGIPWLLFGYWHPAQEVWQIETENDISGSLETSYIICDGTGEDPLCHDSVCNYGLCLSIEDHLTYLGIPMYIDSEEC